MFLQMLEGIHPKDAVVVINMINKTKPKGITRGIVEKAFPSLLQDQNFKPRNNNTNLSVYIRAHSFFIKEH